MTTHEQVSTDPSGDANSIRRCIDARVRAVRDKNADALLSGYAADVRTFDMVEPLENRGIEAVRRRVVEWFGPFATPIDYEIEDVELEVEGTVAFDHHFTHVRGRSVAGAQIDMWFRETVGWRKVGREWKVTHQHSSVPFDMTTLQARLDLRPRS
jgi:ketosteroid isomerase-like protein